MGNTGWSAWGPRTAPSGSLGTAPGWHVPTSMLGVTGKRPWTGGCPHQPGPAGSGARDGTSRQGMAKHGTARQGWARHIARCDGKGGTSWGGGAGAVSHPPTPRASLHPGLCLLWMLGAIKPGLRRGPGCRGGPPPAAGTWRAHACVCTHEDGSCGRARGSCASTRVHVTCPRAREPARTPARKKRACERGLRVQRSRAWGTESHVRVQQGAVPTPRAGVRGNVARAGGRQRREPARRKGPGHARGAALPRVQGVVRVRACP